MIRHRRLFSLGLALASALVLGVAAGDASADRDHDRGDRREWRDRGDDHDRGRWDRGDRWGRHDRRDHRDRWDRSDWRRYERRHDHDRYVRYDHRPRFVRHDLRYVRAPFYCSAHGHGFRTEFLFHDHLAHYHGVPHWSFPRLVGSIGFGWTFGY
jgi:hypothetical protein